MLKRSTPKMKHFKIIFEYHEKMWIANCEELRLTIEEGSFDALIVRMKLLILSDGCT